MSNAEDFDLGEGALAPSDALTRLREKIREALAMQDTVATHDNDLKAAKAALHELRSFTIPELMAEVQSDHFTFDGWECKLKDVVSGTLPKEEPRRSQAMQWLVDHEAEGLIKTELSIEFGRSQHNEAIDLAAKLEKDGYAPAMQTGVHPQTLAAFARQRIADGDEIDLDLLGIYSIRVAEFKPAKAPKGRAKK